MGIGTFRALRHRNYRLYFVGQLVSLLGLHLQITAMTWLAYQMTEQSLWAALVGAVQVLPTFVLGAWGGSLADRWSKRGLIFSAQVVLLLLALLLAILVLTGDIRPWQLLAIAAANGLVAVVDFPARLAFVVDLVGKDDLVNGIALNSLLFNSARALGPALGAVALPALGPGMCFLANALSYLAVLAALAAMDVGPDTDSVAQSGQSPSLREGFRFLAGHGQMRLLLVFIGAMALFGWPVLILLPALSNDVLKAGPAGYGWLLSAIGLGALLGSLLVATYGSLARSRWFLGIGTALAVTSELGLAAADNLALAQGCCVLAGCGLVMVFATGQAMLQLTAGDHNRGVIMGIWSMILSGAQPLGCLLAGRAADRWGLAVVLTLQGLGSAAAGACILALAIRRQRTPETNNRSC